MDAQEQQERHPRPVPQLVDPELQTVIDCVSIDFTSPLKLWEVTSPFGMRLDPFGSRVQQFHNGVDLADPVAKPTAKVKVYAVADGVVVDHWPPPGMYGNKWFNGHGAYGGCIVIEHARGIFTLYGHMNRTFVHEGMKVHKGDVIGYMGDTGFATGRHLHLGVFVKLLEDDGQYRECFIDPMKTVMLYANIGD